MTVLEFGDARAIVSTDGLGCERYTVGEWDILGSGGMAIRCSGADVFSGSDVILSAAKDPPLPRLTAAWRLSEEGLTVELHFANTASDAQRFALSVRVELNPLGDRVQALAPAEDVWPRDLGGTPRPVSGESDLRRPRWIDAPIDATYTRRHFANLRAPAAVIEPASGREVWLTTSADFRELRLSLDTHGAGVLEASLCSPVPQNAARRLAPGESWRGFAQLSVRGVH